MKVEACGGLKKLFEKWQAPHLVANRAARRIGAIVPSVVSHGRIEKIIEDLSAKGALDWDVVITMLGETAARAYKGKRL